MFERTDLQLITERIKEPRSFIQVIVGPRQVGKTTLIKQLLSKRTMPSYFVTADDLYAADNAWIHREWSNARLQLKQSGQSELLFVIDEVQKVSNWSEAVKKEWDTDSFNDTPVKLILLGSSRLLIQKGLTESLAGRFEVINITHWTFEEMHQAFGWSLSQYIYFGGYPGSARLIGDEARWRDYIRTALVETTISKDILMMTRVEKPALLRRLFDIGCRYSSQILSLNKIQGELQENGNLTTLSNYLTLLSDAGMLSGIEKYAADVIRRRASRPKFLVHNNALLVAGQANSLAQIQSDPKEWGRLVESSIGSYLINASVKHRFNLYYWNEGSAEVDFVIEKGGKVVALEVKSGHESASKSLSLFAERFHPHAIFTIGTGGLPIEQFMRMNPLALFDI